MSKGKPYFSGSLTAWAGVGERQVRWYFATKEGNSEALGRKTDYECGGHYGKRTHRRKIQFDSGWNSDKGRKRVPQMSFSTICLIDILIICAWLRAFDY